ncbi:hypothetical protein ACQ86N_27510 [Puia sp. P3]|uniref:hypothetical protein n=1 Tax=Puia sp. P3 TaxID=3423952 RepID=UPI003D66C950
MKYSRFYIWATGLLVAGAAAAVFSGCQKLTENPKGNITPDSYYKTQSDLDAAVAGMYIQLARDGAWGFTSKETSYFGSDDLTTDPGLNKGDQREFDRLQGSSTNSSLPAEWNGPLADDLQCELYPAELFQDLDHGYRDEEQVGG